MTSPSDQQSSVVVNSNIEPAIEVRDLRFRYGEFEAVAGISFDVLPGELFALLGTNGAGKTTTIETLEGFSRPSAGHVSVLGQDPYRRPPEFRALTNAVLQHSGTFPEFTVQETIDLARGLARHPRQREELLDRLGLAHRRRVWVRNLSGGERRRLDLALALATRPRVLFLDEPTTGMDPEGRHEVWEVLKETVAEGVTVLLTTHYLEEAERLADRLAIMHRGELRIAGTVAEVLARWGDRIEFALPPGVRAEDLPSLRGARCAVAPDRGDTWATYTVGGDAGGEIRERAYTATSALVHWAEERGVALPCLRVRSASLEDVFLEIAQGVQGKEEADSGMGGGAYRSEIPSSSSSAPR
ncbi:ABC transporter ATP-binding protein [Nocardiopsis sp. CNT-189]|uniref:ABC transporter ATP-binding protein n=1 Tax=Nocardiopsis oceanisediminis TaxID=2816862 RepID=UPI003B325779